MSKHIEISADESNTEGVNNQSSISKGESGGGADISSGNAIASSVLSALSSMLIVPELEGQLLQAEQQLKLAEERIEILQKLYDASQSGILDPEDYAAVLTGEATPPEINPDGGPS